MLYNICYYVRPTGASPVREWIARQDNSIRPNIRTKIEWLRKNGPKVEGTKSFAYISGPDKGLWELRDVGLGWRIVTYYDIEEGRYVLVFGFRKRNKKVQQSDF